MAAVSVYFPFGQSGFLRFGDTPANLLAWLNRRSSHQEDHAVRAALKKTKFAPPKLGWKRNLELLTDSWRDEIDAAGITKDGATSKVGAVPV